MAVARPMKESTLVRRILRELNTAPRTKAIKIYGNAYGSAGEPDIIGAANGRMFAIEAKVGAGKPTKLQEFRLEQWEAAGARVAVATEEFDVGRFLASCR